MTRYAATTEVPADRSKAEIERTLVRYGADQFMYGWNEHGAVLGFRLGGTMYRVNVPMPSRDEFRLTPSGKERTSVDAINSAWEQATRQRWRAAALYIKATLEAVESGITTMEQAFLSNVLLPSGETFGQWAQPQIRSVYQTGQMPQLLPGLPRGAEK